MKIRRYKKVYKSLNFYVNNFGFFKPFQVLIDGTFCHAALQNGVQIKEDVPKYLGSDVKFVTTPCVILETENLGPKLTGAMKIAKSFGIHKCGHKRPLTGTNCLMSMVGSGNSSRYIIATQDKDLQYKLQNIPAVPILYFNRTSVVLKSPSEISVQSANSKQTKDLGLTEYQEKVLNSLKLKTLGKVEEENDTPYCKKTKGPNPLSRKKKKKKKSKANLEDIQADSHNIKKSSRKRKRIRIPAHVKQELYSTANS